MAANIFGRYVWLIDTIRQHERLTYEEINNLWVESGLSYGEGNDLPQRTFHNHRKAIKDIFDVYIDCDPKDGYRYYIDEPERLEGDGLRSWLIDSYSVLNQVQADKKLEGRILFEDIPSGHKWLTSITQAMREGKNLYITHQGFGSDYENSFEVSPYYLKVIKQRWYLLAHNPYYEEWNKKCTAGQKPKEEFRLYALDRIHNVEMTNKTFKMKKDFDIKKYFEGYLGILTERDVPVERIVMKVYGVHRKYVDSLPLHESQHKIAEDDESMTFEYLIRPTFDFYQVLLAQTEAAVILEPESVRKKMKQFTENMLNNYKDA